MSIADEQLKRIQDKIQQLLRQQSILQKENQQLKDELSGIRMQSSNYLTDVESLRQQVDVLKFSNATMDDGEKKLFEKRLNTYLKEIDKCIAMLSE